MHDAMPDEFMFGSWIDADGALLPTIRFRVGEEWHGFRFTEAEALRFAVELEEWLRPVAQRHGLIDDE